MTGISGRGIMRTVPLYTGVGDRGATALFDGTMVPKDDPRVAVYGDVDELNATVGLARAAGLPDDLDVMMIAVQRDLFAVGARLADPRSRISARVTKAQIGTADVERLEAWIDRVDGALPPGVTPKDMVLAIIGHIGAGGGAGYVIEYAGEAVRALSMEGRMTVCNMSIEAGARAGLIAPDETTFDYLKGRPRVPKAGQWEAAVAQWATLNSDDGAAFDREVRLDAGTIAPLVTWGTSPEDVVPITGAVPEPGSFADPTKRQDAQKALDYMGLTPGTPMTDIAVDRVFIGSCTNSRIEDLREAARVVDGRRVADSLIEALVVPGSGLVKAQAEHEGLDRIFTTAGFSWREPGCSMCLGMNPDKAGAGERVASTSNRNFVGRQGPGARTHLMSPAMAAAAAVTGRLADVRTLD